MINEEQQARIISLIRKEVVPAIGCTEPIAVALCVAEATRLLGRVPERIYASLSANIIKNAMGVGIPGTGMSGLPIAIALGAICGRPELGLEVLRDVDSDAVALGKAMVDRSAIVISLKDDITEKLYIEIRCVADDHEAAAVIAGGHTNFVYRSVDSDIILDKRSPQGQEAEDHSTDLTLETVYEFAVTTPLDKLGFLLESSKLNLAASRFSIAGHYGHALGKIIGGSHGSRLMGDTMFTHIVALTAAACDARMGGAMIPVMSNSGSGNQGISATVPVVVFARENGNTEDEMLRALALSHLTVIYIKQKVGRLSALCGCVVAATGSSCGLTLLMGGGYRQVCHAVKNMVGNLTGMICDGAKPSCALKVTSGVSTAVYAALMAMEDASVSSLEGIVDEDVDRSIDNLTRIGLQGMAQTDREILSIMLSK